MRMNNSIIVLDTKSTEVENRAINIVIRLVLDLTFEVFLNTLKVRSKPVEVKKTLKPLSYLHLIRTN